jgi:hypothetical protein
MNSFQLVLRDYPVTVQSTSPEDALLYALLTYGANVGYSGGDTFTTNAAKEALRRLEAAGVGKVALDYIGQRLNSLSEKYSR